MEAELSVEIDRPIDEVFVHANEHLTEWSVTCVEDEVIETAFDRMDQYFGR